MATYYVRKTGVDTNDGLTPAAAFLTIDKAANTVAAGDTVHIGAGTYAELVTMDTAGTAGNQITFAGDVTGAETGDAGLVIITAFDTQTAAPARNNCLNWNGQKFITWRGVTFNGGSAAVIISDNGNSAHEGDVLEDCAVIPYDEEKPIQIDYNLATTPATDGLQVRRCVVTGSMRFYFDNNEVAEQNMRARIENVICYSNAVGGISEGAVIWYRNGAGTYGTGGLTISHCTINGYGAAVYSRYATCTAYPVTVTHCLGYSIAGYWIYQASGTNGAVISDYNRIHGLDNTISGGSWGANDDVTGDFGMLGGIADWPLYRYWGWSPFLPWEPVSGISGYTNPLIGAGSSTATEDAYGNPRPMGRNTGGALTADIGAVEARTRPVDETTTVHGGGHAARFSGAGFYETFVPVSAAETTISVYAYKDANYTGDAPIMEIYNIPGVADQSDAMAGAAESWEQLSCTFTPTAAGLVRVRLRSRDTSATGECFFDDLEVN